MFTLAACSDSDSSPVPSDDGIDATNYRAKLSTALDQLRAEYFNPFIEAPSTANRLFQRPLPDATEYFGPEPFPTGAESSECDSGSVTRDVTSSDAQLLTITAIFDFKDCEMMASVFNGRVEIELDGDTPSRLGGQIGRVVMQFSDMEIIGGASPDTTSTLTGSFKTDSGWGAAFLSYNHEYTTESYQKTVDNSSERDATDITITNASYKQQLESDHLDPETAYYRLSESGSLTAIVTQNQIVDEYDISIDPTLLYASQLGANSLPVYGDDVLSGKISYSEVPMGSVTATPDESASDMMLYVVDDGIESFTEIDEWLFPIDCNDNSSMNRRDLCNARR